MGAFDGVAEVKRHPWFRGVDWVAVLNKLLTPPFVPNARTSNFDPSFGEVDFAEFEKPRFVPESGDPFF